MALLRRALMEEIAVGSPRLQSRLHGWRGDRLIEEAQRRLVGLFSPSVSPVSPITNARALGLSGA
jgi:hypothetical protein